MATIVNNPAPQERVVEVDRTGDATAGWVVAVIILIAVIAGLFAWFHYHRAAAPAQGGNSTNITVTPPALDANSGGSGTAP